MSPVTNERPVPPTAPLERPLTVHVRLWSDELVERFGFDPRSAYLDRYWLPVLGPSTVLVLRRLAEELDACDDPEEGTDIDMVVLGRALGLGTGSGRHAPLWRSLDRAVSYGAIKRTGNGLAVRRRIAPLPRRLLARLPSDAAAEHDAWIRQAGEDDELRFACRVAWLLLEEHRTRASTERTLMGMGFRPATAVAAADWALIELDAAAPPAC